MMLDDDGTRLKEKSSIVFKEKCHVGSQREVIKQNGRAEWQLA
jgi:hypothetical protein